MLKLIYLFLLFGHVKSYIYTYNNETLKLGHLEYRRVALYTPKDAPEVQSEKSESYISVDVQLTRDVSKLEKTGIIQMTVSHSSTFDEIGYDSKEHRHFCCTQDLLSLGLPGCTIDSLGKLIIPPETNPTIQSHEVSWHSDTPATVSVSHKFEIPITGRYYLMFSSCLNSTGDVYMTGNIVWMNPFGYLPGELYHFIPLFGYLTLAYAILGVCWAILCMCYCSDLLHLQHYVSIVIVLGFLESATWYLDYQKFNESGKRAIGPVVAAVILSSVKRTLSRLLVLIVCMGYGVMKPALTATEKQKVICLGVVYFIFSTISDVMSSYSQMTHVMQHVRAFFLFPVAALDSLFFLWILQEISSNIQQLTAKNQQVKLTVYRRFWQILVSTAIFSVGWASYQVFVTARVSEDDRWEDLWAFDGMWYIVYFLVLVAIAVLLRPHENASAIIHSEEIGTREDESDESDEGVEMAALRGSQQDIDEDN
eukprot:c21992_g2_i1.p1 GENE.c21992_g2_i1~~c21992_g2_i1.p1  ORF type:complete len:491 (-),score=165.17 c21992_g2_i1:156-1595(-)